LIRSGVFERKEKVASDEPEAMILDTVKALEPAPDVAAGPLSMSDLVTDMSEEAQADPAVGSGTPLDILEALGHFAEGADLDGGAGDVGGAFDDLGDVSDDGGASLDEFFGFDGPVLAQGPGPKAPAPGPKAPAPGPQAPTSTTGPAPQAPAPAAPAPKPKTPWADVDKPSARKDQDLDWIENLPAHTKNEADGAFADGGREEKRIAQRVNKNAELRTLDKSRDKDLEGIRAGLVKKKVKNPKQDPAYTDAVVRWKAERAQKLAELTAAERAKVSRGTPNQTAVAAPGGKVPIDSAKTAARKDFQEWNREVFGGDMSKAKKHYQGIDEVDKGKGMWLAKGARERFIAARKKFEESHKDSNLTLKTTTVAHSMRGLHQDRKGIGMLGHALGVSIDLLANDSPNIQGRKGKEPFRTTAYMLEKFGADPTTGARGRAQMNLELDGVRGDDRIKRLGQNTINNKVDAKDEKTAQDVRSQFLEMSATSERFKKALPDDSMTLLKSARNTYFEQQQDEAEIAKLLNETKGGKAPDKLAELTRLQAKVVESKKQVKAAMDEAFMPWTNTLESENKDDRGTEAFEQDNGAFIANQRKELKTLGDAELDAFAVDHGLTARTDFKPGRGKKAKTYKVALAEELAAREKESAKQLKNATGGIEIRDAVLAKVRDPSRVFGRGTKQADGSFTTDLTVKDPSVMQLLENGFVRDDGLDVQGKPGSKREVLNADTVETLARFGFAPGATFLDTHHYDFIEGYDEAPGGRSWANLNEDRYSPEGEKIKPVKRQRSK